MTIGLPILVSPLVFYSPTAPWWWQLLPAMVGLALLFGGLLWARRHLAKVESDASR
jgi:hypothetical protein